ncbi:MAG: zinc ABC transporter ATP-binding protein ZnuC [Gammaproteobacteria bacterium]
MADSNIQCVELIRCNDVTVTLGGHKILEGIDVTIRGGEIVTLIGPNGAGKSTLVKVILGLLRPERGTVERLPGLTVGYLPQHLHVEPVLPLTVRRVLTLTRRATKAEQDSVLTLVGVPHLANATMHSLSGGERQRVLLARALLREPDLLVLDEPTQGVDHTGEAELYQLIADLREERGYGVLMVSHDLHLVMAATDRVICINHHVCCAGKPDDVQLHPEYQELFGPSVAHRLAVYTHNHDHHHRLSGEVDHDHRQPAEQAGS